MTTAAAPNQLPESLFSQEQEGQVSAPLTPEHAPEGAAPHAGVTEDGLPQMPPDQLQQALAQQFQQAAPQAAQPAPVEQAAPMPVEPVAQAAVEPVAQMPAEQPAPQPEAPVAHMPAEQMAPVAPAAPVEQAPQVPAEPAMTAPVEVVAQMPAEQTSPAAAAPMTAEPVAEMPVEQIMQMAVQATEAAEAPAQPQHTEQAAPEQQPLSAEQVLAQHVAAPEAVAAQMAGAEAPQPAAAIETPPVAETVLAAIPHPDAYEQMPPATANAGHAIPGLLPEAQSQLAAQARYVPAEPAARAPEAPEAAPAAVVEAAAAAPALDAPAPVQAAPVQPSGTIPEALEALSQPVVDPASAVQPQAVSAEVGLAPEAAPQPAVPQADPAQLAEAVAQQPATPETYAEAMLQQPEQAPEAQMDPQAGAEILPADAHLAPGAAGVALATSLPAITELPVASQEKPLVLGSDLRQLSPVSAAEQKKTGLAGLFSKKKDADEPVLATAPAPVTGRVSVLGDDAGDKKKGFSLAGLFSRKKKADDNSLPRQIFNETQAAPALATPADLQPAILTPTAAALPGAEPALAEGLAPADALAPAAAAGAKESGPVREEIMLFVGKNAEAFADAWDKHCESGGKLQMSWSTPGFLLSFMWLAYRKLYKLALGGFAFVAGMTLLNGFAALAALLVVMIAVGLFGKSLYIQSASKQVVEIMQSAGDPNSYVNNLRIQGGVSLPAAIGLGVLTLVVAATKVLPGMF